MGAGHEVDGEQSALLGDAKLLGEDHGLDAAALVEGGTAPFGDLVEDGCGRLLFGAAHESLVGEDGVTLHVHDRLKGHGQREMRDGTVTTAPNLRRRGVSTNGRIQGLPRTTSYRREKKFLQCIGLGICSTEDGHVLQLSGYRE